MPTQCYDCACLTNTNKEAYFLQQKLQLISTIEDLGTGVWGEGRCAGESAPVRHIVMLQKAVEGGTGNG